MAALENGIHVVLGEIAVLVSNMRKNARWAAGSPEENRDTLLQQFITLKQELANVQALDQIATETFLHPFLEVVRSETTTGPITGIALSSIGKFIKYNLINPSALRAAQAIETVADAVTHAKFVGTERETDEIVLMRILEVLRALLLSSAGRMLSNESVCELMQSSFRICFENSLSKLLRQQAQSILADMVLFLFSNLSDLQDVADEQSDADSSSIYHHLHRSTSTSVEAASMLASLSTVEPQSGQPEDIKEESEVFTTTNEQDQGAQRKDLASSSPSPSPIQNEHEVAGPPPSASSPRPLSTRLNSRGVRFTQKEPNIIFDNMQTPFGVPCIAELLRFLTSLINLKDKQNTPIQIGLGLHLIVIALEAGSHQLHVSALLCQLVDHDLMRGLVGLLGSDNIELFTASLRGIFLILNARRQHLKFQIEKVLQVLMAWKSTSFEHQEARLEFYLQLCRMPSFIADLYLNFDCNLYCEELCATFLKHLCQLAKATSKTQLPVRQMLALECLLSPLRQMVPVCQEPPSVHVHEPTTPLPTFSSTSVDAQLPAISTIGHVQSQKTLLREGIELFNQKPKKGIAFLQEKGLLSTPLDDNQIAAFLRANPQLDKTYIGEYIGALSHVSIMNAFIKSFDFSDKTLDEALRALLTSFRLPGEAQIIERIVESFAEHWFSTNEGDNVIVNCDAAFILSYSIILLNVDQHNPKNKKPMQLEDFVRNQRGLNEKKDFPREYLERIYNNIRNHEIVMPEEHEGELRDSYEWHFLSSRSLLPASQFVSSFGEVLYVPIIFQMAWPFVSQTFFKTYDICKNDVTSLQQVANAIPICGELCAAYGDASSIDGLVAELCQRGNLPDALEGSVHDTAQGSKIERALRTLVYVPISRISIREAFGLADRHGDCIRDAWKELLATLRCFVVARVIPTPLRMICDFTSSTGESEMFLREQALSVSQESSSLLFGLFFSQPEAAAREDDTALDSLREKAMEIVEPFQLPALISNTRSLPGDALEALIDVLVYYSHGPTQAEQVTYSYHETAAAFFLEQLVEVVLHNKDRAATLWPRISNHTKSLLGEVQPNFLFERALVAELRLVSRLVSREPLRQVAEARLQDLAQLETIQGTAAVQCAYGLRELVLQNRDTLPALDCWTSIFMLLEKCIQNASSMSAALTLMSLIVDDSRLLTNDSLPELVNTLCICAKLVREDAAGMPDVAFKPETESRVPPPLLGVSLLDLIQRLYYKAHATLAPHVEGSEASKAAYLWDSCWQPLLRSVSILVLHAHTSIWQQALAKLERFLLCPDLEGLDAEHWYRCFSDVLFDLLQRLLASNSHLKAGSLEEIRTRSCSLLSRIYLQQLNTIAAHEQFPNLWLKILDLLDKFMSAGQSGLEEAVPEQVKNSLLVMTAAGILSKQECTLWDLTWDRVHAFLPGLHAELYPESIGGAPSRHASSSSDAPQQGASSLSASHDPTSSEPVVVQPAAASAPTSPHTPRLPSHGQFPELSIPNLPVVSVAPVKSGSPPSSTVSL